MEDEIKNFSGNILNRNTYKFDKPIGFFGTKPAHKRAAGTSADRALKEYGLIVSENIRDDYRGNWDLTAGSFTLPSGWSIAWNGSGQYTVTHNLSNTDYDVVITPDGGSPKLFSVTKNSNTFVASFENDSGSASATASSFILYNYT